MNRQHRDEKLKVLISNPNYSLNLNYLPGIYGILKSATPKGLAQSLDWLEPIYFAPAAYGKNMNWDFKDVDVFALSNYMWNREFNFFLAQIAKKQNPQIVIVAGGPDPSHQDSHFFSTNDFIDAVVIQDAEIPFSKIISSVADQSWPNTPIPGVLKRNTEKVLKPELPSGDAFARSYWLESATEYEKMIHNIRLNPKGIVIVPYETDRGCPFQCTFCDWGSNTFSKMRQFPMERIAAEIDWIGLNKIEMVVITNSNFGMFERDIQIAELFANTKKKYGYPREVAYSLPKTDLRHALEILKIFAINKMILYNSVPFQTTDRTVLRAVSRKPLPAVEIDKYIEISRDTNTDIHPQLILGQPGDDYQKFLKSLSDLAEKNLFDGIAIYPFLVLPNAPANDPKYREKWKMKTVQRPIGPLALNDSSLPVTMSEFCIETSSYGSDEYIQMWSLGYLYPSLLDAGILRFPMIYFNRMGIPFSVLLSDLQNSFFKNPRWSFSHQTYKKVENHLSVFVTSDIETSRVEIYCQNVDAHLEPHEYLVLEFLLNIETVLSEAKEFFLNQYAELIDLEQLEDLWTFQKHSLVLPSTDPRAGNSCLIKFNWLQYFDSLNPLTPLIRFDSPTFLHLQHKSADRSTEIPFSYTELTGAQRLSQYYLECISTFYLKPRTLLEARSQGSQYK